MAKRSKRRPSRGERNQASCIWGLISIFRFGHGRSTNRLLGNRMRTSKQCVVAPSNTKRILSGHAEKSEVLSGHTEKSEVVSDVEEKKIAMAVVKTIVKEIMVEEMFNEQGSTKQSNFSDTGFEQNDSRKGSQVKQIHGRKNKAYGSYSDNMGISKFGAEICLMPEESCEAHLRKSSDILDLEMTMEELAFWINQRNAKCTNHDLCSKPDSPAGHAVVARENIVAAIKALVEQRVNDCINLGEGGKCRSKELMDTFSSNGELFLKLLHDPNSALAQRIQNLEVARFEKDQMLGSVTGTHLSEEKPTNLKDDGFSSGKQLNFFRRRTKSLDSFASERDEEIVISRPGSKRLQSPDTATRYSPHSPCNVANNAHNERNRSQFSFSEIKRKLKNAMGKERHGLSYDSIIHESCSKQQNRNNNEDKSQVVENFSWSSPNRNHFYSERFANPSTILKRVEQTSKSRDKSLQAVKETCQYPNFWESNIYSEAKKHLCEMLNNGVVNAESTSQQLPKSLGGILCLPEYNSSPFCGPRKHVDDVFITAQMRLSPRGIVKNNVSGLAQENHITQASSDRKSYETMSYPLCDKVQSSNTNINVPGGEDHDNSSEVQSCTEHITVHEATVPSYSSKLLGIEEMTESRSDEADGIVSISSEPSGNANQIDVQKGDIREVESEESSPQCLKDSNQGFKLDLFREDQILSPPVLPPVHSPGAVENKDSEDAIDNTDRASPISVLEPLFTDDDISPASTSQRVGKEVEPRQIHFKEQSCASERGTCMKISLEGEESAFEYVEAVLLGSGLNWDEFLLRWFSLIEVLDPSLFDEVELFSSRPRHDQKLLFDCSNEVLKEACETHFEYLTGRSSVSHNIMPVPTGMDLINKVWKRVECHLFWPPMSHSLDQLVKTDMGQCGKCLNIRSDIELTCYNMGEMIFDELVEDTVLTFTNDTIINDELMILG
ncbi:uncharacterized protein [Primulina huaijiensis]|uniref:uncharacterized protein isoform X1 n=1 Tax=Primulina huaijiensis TaxID=1492673 RepID=UPI003CC76841